MKNVGTDDGAGVWHCKNSAEAHVPDHGGDELSEKQEDDPIRNGGTHLSSEG